MKLHRKGQGLVEFAIVLLIAIPFFIGGYLVFMLCYDYITIASLARESAREMAVQTTSANMLTARTSIIDRKKQDNAILGGYYAWNPQSGLKGSGFIVTPQPDITDPYVNVEISATRGNGGVGDIFEILPTTITARATMYWEGGKTSTIN